MNKQELERILKNSPEGATHKDSEGYIRADVDKWYFMSGRGEWCGVDHDEANLFDDVRSLSDIKQIVELLEQVEKLKEVACNYASIDGAHHK